MNKRSKILLLNVLVSNQFGGSKKKWTTLEHNGVLFPPEYTKHNVPVIYDGVDIILDKDAEEAATLYARYIESDYVKNSVFRNNFWQDWKKLLGKNHTITNFNKVDFRKIYDHILQQKEQKKLVPSSKESAEEIEKYKTAIVDGRPQPVGNFRIEPPGIFLGRGCNPKSGKIKNRIYPEDIIINIGKNTPVPEPLPGHKWKRVVHDQSVEWLASWKDDITGKIKYVWLGAQSDFKAKSDMNKFELARKLKTKIKQIKKTNTESMHSDDMRTRQIATALYFIDSLALRVGNEKGKDEADTVGVSSLRVEHVTLLDNNKLKLDFLGKDSVRYVNTITVDPIVYDNIARFTRDKNPNDKLFNLITSSDINDYLRSFMKNLTAKVFRTYNASSLFQKELDKLGKKISEGSESDKINALLDGYIRANGKVALLCNHQKNINKSTNTQITKLKESIKKTRAKIKELKNASKPNKDRIKKEMDKLNKLKAKKEIKSELKNISLGTSKINYIDPRITVAFMKQYNIPINKLFTKTLQEKFKWAMDVDQSFKF